MKICASLSSADDIDRIGKADMAEVRMDIFDRVPEIKGKELIVTFRKEPDLSVLPKNFKGMIDVGEFDVPNTENTISSVHNYSDTPYSAGISSVLNNLKGDVVKGAYHVDSFTDLKNLYDASLSVKKKHVLLGMGEMGTITRIRQSKLGNEFTFAYIGEPTAPGQLSLEQMIELGDDPMIVGILGHPLDKSLSPKMHNAVMKKENINGIYLKFDSLELDHVRDVIIDYDIKGMNVTIPHKSFIMEHLDHIDKRAEAVGAFNTVVNDNGTLKGYNTDLIGIEKAMEIAGFDPKGKKALIMGSGGAARACAFFLNEKDCSVTVTGRNEDTAKEVCRDLGCNHKPKGRITFYLYDLIINCTPVGMYAEGEYPANIYRITGNQTVFDMVYGVETPMKSFAKEVGAKIISGEDMLAAQGAASLEMWTGKNNLFEKMREELN